MKQYLQYAESVTLEVGQAYYTITTFDLGACMKAFPIVWNNPTRYEKQIVMIGAFHAVCAFMKMFGKKMNVSGLNNILVEAGLVSCGSLHRVLSGKDYSRAMVCHKALLEALERLLLSEFVITRNATTLLDKYGEVTQTLLQDLLESPSPSSLDAAMNDNNLQSLNQDYRDVKDTVRKGQLGKTAVRKGQLGKTAQFWMSYMDQVCLILKITQAVKLDDFSLYAHCLFEMSEFFFSFDGHNYSLYLAYFAVFMANVEETHPGYRALLQNGSFIVARSFVPGSRCPVDKTIEETFMKQSKSHGGAGGCGAGLTGLVNN